MSQEIKRISIDEFRDLGFIQEINRRLLHPVGLALEVVRDEPKGEAPGPWRLGGVWDYREDPEGICYVDTDLRAKAESVQRMEAERHSTRQQVLGYVVQPTVVDDS